MPNSTVRLVISAPVSLSRARRPDPTVPVTGADDEVPLAVDVRLLANQACTRSPWGDPGRVAPMSSADPYGPSPVCQVQVHQTLGAGHMIVNDFQETEMRFCRFPPAIENPFRVIILSTGEDSLQLGPAVLPGVTFQPSGQVRNRVVVPLVRDEVTMEFSIRAVSNSRVAHEISVEIDIFFGNAAQPRKSVTVECVDQDNPDIVRKPLASFSFKPSSEHTRAAKIPRHRAWPNCTTA